MDKDLSKTCSLIFKGNLLKLIYLEKLKGAVIKLNQVPGMEIEIRHIEAI